MAWELLITAWEHGVLVTGPPGNSLHLYFSRAQQENEHMRTRRTIQTRGKWTEQAAEKTPVIHTLGLCCQPSSYRAWKMSQGHSVPISSEGWGLGQAKRLLAVSSHFSLHLLNAHWTSAPRFLGPLPLSSDPLLHFFWPDSVLLWPWYQLFIYRFTDCSGSLLLLTGFL